MIGAKPDLWLFLGDAVYADTDGKTAWLITEKQLAGEWNRLADKPEFQRARANIPMMATWDNHDYGSHAGGVEFPVKEASKRIFLDFFGEPADSERRQTPGIYDAKIFGTEGKRVQIILLTGNVHFAELSKRSEGPYQLFELTSSGMTHVNKVYAEATNDYRIAGPYAGINFGLVQIDWEANPSPTITLKAIGAEGQTAFSHSVRLGELVAGNGDVKQEMIICTEPRPQICTMDYRPVCAQLGDGTFKTYSNGCTACTDLVVTGYRDGACEE